MISPQSVQAAETVLDALSGLSRAERALSTYERTAEMEGDAAIQIWHLVLSLMDLCEARGANFETILQQAQKTFAQDLSGNVDAQVLLLLFDLMGFCKSHDIDFGKLVKNIREERPIINGG